MIKQKLTGLGTAPRLADHMGGIVNNTLTAAGSSQGTAYLMNLDDMQVFTTVAASTGCIFGANLYAAGDEVWIVNHGANTLSVYPATGGKIANGSTNAAFSLAATVMAVFKSIDGLSWAATMPS